MPDPRLQIGPLQIGIILLAVATALIHLLVIIPPGPVFILNALGYLGLVAALYLPIKQLAGRRRPIRWVLIAYTALTILLWVLAGTRDTVAYIDKAVEVLLIVLLVVEDRQADQSND